MAAAERRSAQARLRAEAYLLLHRAGGGSLPRHYREFLRQDRERSYPEPGDLLAQTLEHAVTTVPHYRGVATAAEIAADPFAALARFPLLDRDTVRAESRRLLSEEGDRGKWIENTSGGSTGEPVSLRQDPEHLALTVAAREVYSTWAGGGLGEPELYIWGSEKDLEGSDSARNRLGNRLLRRTLLNAFLLTDESIEAILDHLRDGPPHLVLAYAQAGYEVARFASRRGIAVPPQRGTIATAGTLYPFMREQLEETFGCAVLNRYGSRETGDMAGECEHRSGLHVLPWTCHVEVVGADRQPVGPGEEGDVAVTGFTNRAMPLVRYLIGDRARLPDREVECPCGRRTQMLAEVTGRSVDMFLGPDGQMVDGEYFTHLMYFRPWLRQFQVVQRAPDEVLFRIAVEAEVPTSDREEIVAKTRAVLGEVCGVSFEQVETIEPSASGKLRYTLRDF
jgi:phenylacetate-coenzyme A ligase PaaK-like adenylate-forming protein